MTTEEIRQRYSRHPKLTQLAHLLQAERSRVFMKGMAGSAASFIAAASLETDARPVLFILEDKERAAYWLNDLENILGREAPAPNGTQARTLLFFPRSARVPYQAEETENANVAMRAEVLHQISRHPERCVVVTYPEALAEKVVNKVELSRNTYDISTGSTISLEFMDDVFHNFGFEKVDYVYEPGQYAVRGGILDVFSFSNDHPFRIELFGNDVDSIRKFDPATQLSITKLTKATIVPNVTSTRFEEQRISLQAFMPPETIIWLRDAEGCLRQVSIELDKAISQFGKLTSELQHQKPEELFLSRGAFLGELESKRLVEFGWTQRFVEGVVVNWEMIPQPSFAKNFDMLGQNLAANEKQGYTNIIASGQPKQIERLYQIFEDKDHAIHFIPLAVELNEGFIDMENKLLCYTDHQIFERHHRFRLKEGFRKNQQALSLKEITGLRPGDFVVHIDHGIGQFAGLQKLDVNGKEQEAIRLVYKGGDTLYVSIHSLHRISKYIGKEGTAPSVDKLGSNAWQNLKRKTKTRVKEIAFDLLKLYARRRATRGHAFLPDSYLQTELEASFIYEDTPDQQKTMNQVKEDMESPVPMDRLVCGDVGFGKTEIAIRAAFKAVADGKQVAVLVPTTILAMQHYKTFSSRLHDFPCTVDYVNRFKSAAKQTETMKKLEKGEIDILIGTHALVGKKVKFKDLGLLIIDEEQKFGVGVKDKLKTMRENVDTLTLTATPIPRTLQFSLMGARDLSMIQTPPPNRYPVETNLVPFSEEVVRDAVAFELSRSGQVFFVHNRIQNLAEVAGMIQRLVPDARIGMAHGQLEGHQLEDIMSEFLEDRLDVLVCTAIVESGLDIGNANTILVNDAHQFGLSDLHQLRGRVGRTNKKAFCYLLSPPLHLLTDDARKRLTAVSQFSDLGSGLHIAMRDLDIRGAGNLLGGEQSGFINDIGYEAYQKILDEAIQELKEEKFKDLFEEELSRTREYVRETILETDFELLIPDHYVGSIAERIALYKDLDNTKDEAELAKFTAELTDRFGPIPAATEALIGTIRLRWLARDIGFEKMVMKSGKLIGYFVSRKDSPYYQSDQFSRVIEFIRQNPNWGKMYEKEDSLRISFSDVASVADARKVLEAIATAGKN